MAPVVISKQKTAHENQLYTTKLSKSYGFNYA